jgi:hypothetical protein
MPTIFRSGPYRFFFFFANEGLEPKHVHVEAGGAYAKLWLEPVGFADSRRFNARQMTAIRRLVALNRQRCLEAWDEFFSHKG